MISDVLKELVSKTVKTLGLAIKEVYGEKSFQEIEYLRLAMKKVRGKDPQTVEKAMNEAYLSLKERPQTDLRNVTQAFSLMLELINAAEAAFRTHRLSHYSTPSTKRPKAIIYVFTSHPTEARSAPYLALMKDVNALLLTALQSDFKHIEARLLHLLRIAVRIPIANTKRPQVKDEMEQIFGIILDEDILSEQIALAYEGAHVDFRTWVGGDKDGHPKVNAQTMVVSFNHSRKKILSFIDFKMGCFEKELKLLSKKSPLDKRLHSLKASLRGLKKVQKDDGKRVKIFEEHFQKLLDESKKYHLTSPVLLDIEKLLCLYPALVLPLELREDSAMIHQARLEKNEPITLMLKTLKSIARGHDPKGYVRGFIISMCMTTQDYLDALYITERDLGALGVPVIPLFENEKGLINSIDILSGAMKEHNFITTHQKKWSSRFEIMVGYSDSSKENGVLPSRLMVEEAIFKIETYLLTHKLTPVFFHGSGGSTSRGGGTVEEQLSWWPQSALDIFKVTIQGEMVQRNFTNHLIMRSQVGKVLESYHKIKPQAPKHSTTVKTLARAVQEKYRELITDETFQHLTSVATPYQYLNLLRIGSRPSKRQKTGEFSLRAIPWILCWTQTRLLLPFWWGTGSAWQSLSHQEKLSIKKDYQQSPLLQSYLKNFGFTVARVDLGVWNFHLNHSELRQEEKKYWREKITKEYELSLEFFRELSGEDNFTWFRPWLSESIYFRSSMIHPLNVLQKIALEREDHNLLRDTVTGIACGMLTTG